MLDAAIARLAAADRNDIHQIRLMPKRKIAVPVFFNHLLSQHQISQIDVAYTFCNCMVFANSLVNQ